jgi:hypothetical protein
MLFPLDEGDRRDWRIILLKRRKALHGVILSDCEESKKRCFTLFSMTREDPLNHNHSCAIIELEIKIKKYENEEFIYHQSGGECD